MSDTLFGALTVAMTQVIISIVHVIQAKIADKKLDHITINTNARLTEALEEIHNLRIELHKARGEETEP